MTLCVSGKGRINDAEKSLCWLRGWVSPSYVSKEFNDIRQVMVHPAGNDNNEKASRWKAFTKRTFYGPFAVVILAFFLSSFGGTSTLQTFAVLIFTSMRAPMDKYTSTILLGVAELIGTAVCVTAIHFTGKRNLTFVSIAGTGLSFFGSTIYIYLIKFYNIDGDLYSWLPTALLIGAAFFAHMGIRLLPWILAGEVFPSSVNINYNNENSSKGIKYYI